MKVEDCELSPTIFLGFVELEGQGATAIHRCLLDSLNSVGFNMDYLRKNLVALFSDGASVMLGRSSGVGVRLRNDLPNIMQLVLEHSVKEKSQVNHFKIFMDKIYAIVYQSNKNQMQLYNISE